MSSRIASHRLVPLLALTALALTGCNRAERGPAPPPSQEAQQIGAVAGRFGDPYEVFTSEWAGSDTEPALFGDTLVVPVGYSGGCGDHAFEVDQEVRADTLVLWLRHDDGGDDCEAYLRDEVEATIELRASGGPVVLENPQGGPPFVLKWGG